MSRSECHQLLRRLEAVDVRERGVGIEILPVGGRAEDAFDRVLEQAVIAALRLAQRLLGFVALGDVLDEAFDGDDAARLRRARRAALPHPAHVAVGVQDAVLEVEAAALPRAPRGSSRARAARSSGMRELFVRRRGR